MPIFRPEIQGRSGGYPISSLQCKWVLFYGVCKLIQLTEWRNDGIDLYLYIMFFGSAVTRVWEVNINWAHHMQFQTFDLSFSHWIILCDSKSIFNASLQEYNQAFSRRGPGSASNSSTRTRPWYIPPLQSQACLHHYSSFFFAGSACVQLVKTSV